MDTALQRLESRIKKCDGFEGRAVLPSGEKVHIDVMAPTNQVEVTRAQGHVEWFELSMKGINRKGYHYKNAGRTHKFETDHIEVAPNLNYSLHEALAAVEKRLT